MPIYEYRRPDGTTFEIQQSFAEDALSVDPETGVPVTRVLHAPAVHFKGKGFYNTDYGTRKRQRELASSAEGSSDSTGSSSDSSSGDSSSGDSSSPAADASKGSSTDSSSSSSEGSSKSKASEPGSKGASKPKDGKRSDTKK
jgi:predicted nucleic acid-binding Zn ribbon protein